MLSLSGFATLSQGCMCLHPILYLSERGKPRQALKVKEGCGQTPVQSSVVQAP